MAESPYVIDDPRFRYLTVGSAKVERLATGFRWSEGPVWFADARCLLFSDIPNQRIMRWSDDANGGGGLTVFRQPSNFSNGQTRDRQGRLVTCEHGTRRVTRTEIDGSVTVLAERFDGKRLNSPNDVVVTADGAVWFSDPTYGILSDYEGYASEPEQPVRGIYRLDPAGRLSRMADEFLQPNGLAFSPDEKILYIVESRGTPTRKILAYDVSPDGRALSNRRVHIDAGPGTPDGMRCDVDGNLWCGWGMGDPELDGVRIFNPAGKPIGHIHLPERCANVCFGGRKRNRLFMAASQSLYALYVNTQGVEGG